MAELSMTEALLRAAQITGGGVTEVGRLSMSTLFGIGDGTINDRYGINQSEARAAAARQAKADAEQAEQDALDARLDTVKARHQGNVAALAVLDHHRPQRYDSAQHECAGCDEGGYAQSGAYWPCSTVTLLNDGVEP